ncbi:MAG: T9SS type B sorting domain-containing protein, partial [Flavobacteriales bacterium]|nr:T9SS type B sorting domain-containing protein [Flavobacteriales bacterium]
PCIGSCITFNDLSAGTPTSWAWSFINGTPTSSTNQNPTICYDSIGTFDVQLIVSNSFGTDTLLISNYITVDSCIQQEPIFIIPNVFSPNNDGNNDLFFVESFGLETLSMKIYNRWGEKLFESNQLDAAWDGRTESGTICSEGTYFYIISITISEKKEVYKGTLSLLR